MIKKQHSFARFAYFTLGLTLLVILWGAFVRLSGSGDGCGASWPLCQGVLVPRSPTSEMAIEFLHRMSSGLAFLMVVVLLVWSRKLYRRGAAVRRFAAWSLVFMISESLIGAALVMFEWVDQSTAPGRVGILVLHQVNTFLLISSILLTARSATRDWLLDRSAARQHFRKLLAGYSLLCLTAVFGVVAALGSMLYPAPTLLEGVQMDFIAASPMVVRIRILHPLVAVTTAAFLWWLVVSLSSAKRDEYAGPAGMLLGVLLFQLMIGFAAWLAHGPVVPKLVHLLLADLAVIAFTAFAADMLTKEKMPAESTEPQNVRLAVSQS
ncbi:MAG: COX15/CtaA family protein [Bdellovibrionales bacterium]|nr:COX15/CtaA family protein [Bdellovibrionales bacterium]